MTHATNAKFHPGRARIAPFLCLVLPLSLPILSGIAASRKMEDLSVSTGVLLGAITSIVAFAVIALCEGPA